MYPRPCQPGDGQLGLRRTGARARQPPQAYQGLLCSPGCWSRLPRGLQPSGILSHVRSAPPGSAREHRASPRPRKALQWRIILCSCWSTGSICVVSSVKSLEEGDVEAKACGSPAAPRTLKHCSMFTTTGRKNVRVF